MITPENYYQTLTALGFKVVPTGGGCTAWQKTFPNENYVLVTCDFDHKLEDSLYNEGCPIVVGAYNQDSGQLTDDYHEGDFNGLLTTIERFCALARGET